MEFDFRSKHSHLATWATALGAWSARHAKVVLVGMLVVTAALAPHAAGLGYDDDVIQFLPENDPEVITFRRVGERFHGLSIALVGVEVAQGDVFTPTSLRALRELTLALRAVDGVSFSTSFTELRDVVEDHSEDGEPIAVVSDLVGPIPEDGSEIDWAKSLRKRVLARKHVAGDLVSEDGAAALVLAHVAHGAKQKAVAEGIRAEAERIAQRYGRPFRLYFGGAPFIGAYVADGAQRDIATLSPYVAVAIIFIVLLTARSLAGAAIALASVGIGIVWLMGAMALLGRPLTLVSSSLPVLLVALGSAYSIHLLTRTLAYLDGGTTNRVEAALLAVREVAAPIFAAGLTTALGFVSFLVMDIRPMREFGLWMAAGTLLVVVLALVVVPAACAHLPLRARAEGRAPSWALLSIEWLAGLAVKHPRVGALVAVGVLAAASTGSGLVETHMETRRFFEEGSEPVVAEDFLESRLGGSLFLQVEVAGPMKHPIALRQVERLADYAASLEGVHGVQSIVDPIVLAAGAMTGAPRIPYAPKTAAAVAALVDDDPNLRLLVDERWEHALVQIKLGRFDTRQATALAEDIREEAKRLASTYVMVPRAELTGEMKRYELQGVAAHVRALFAAEGARDVALNRIAEVLSGAHAVSAEALYPNALRALRGALVDDEVLYLREGAELEPVARFAAEQLARDGAIDATLLQAQLLPLVSEEDKTDAAELAAAVAYIRDALLGEVNERLESGRADAALALLPRPPTETLRARVERTVAVLSDDWAPIPSHLAPEHVRQEQKGIDVGVVVSGYPMVYAGMNKSVQQNQTFSLLVASALTFLALAWFFRSWLLALAVSLPAGMTLLVTFGVMGFAGVPMDVGTSMIASIGLGVGLDYGVHLMWYLGARNKTNQPAAETPGVGWGIVINAAEVAAGFAILSLGTIVPMQNFGALTALAMVVSAFAALAFVPAMGGAVARWQQRRMGARPVG